MVKPRETTTYLSSLFPFTTAENLHLKGLVYNQTTDSHPYLSRGHSSVTQPPNQLTQKSIRYYHYTGLWIRLIRPTAGGVVGRWPVVFLWESYAHSSPYTTVTVVLAGERKAGGIQNSPWPSPSIEIQIEPMHMRPPPPPYPA